MSEPTTAAGQAFADRWKLGSAHGAMQEHVAAIETQAAAAARTALLDELEAAVEEIRSAYSDTDGSRQPGLVEKRDVLSEINRRRP